MMKILSSIVILILFGCNQNVNTVKEKTIEAIAIVNKDTIFLNEIDSMIDGYIYNLRIRAIDQKINNILIHEQAQKENVSVEELILEIEKGVNQNSGGSLLKYYLDSLKGDNRIEILLMPDIFRSIDTRPLLYNVLQQRGRLNVYIISDFKCPHCASVKKQIDQIIKANPKVTFYTIFHSDYIDELALFAHACGLQGKFKDCYDWLFEGRNAFLGKDAFLQFAFEMELDLDQLELDMKDDRVLREYMMNKKTLIDNEVNKVPCFIVNTKLLIDGEPINYLQKVIDDEL